MNFNDFLRVAFFLCELRPKQKQKKKKKNWSLIIKIISITFVRRGNEDKK